ncbi:TatD family hydrolase [Tenacibaculum sp. TC6]|uniref:TatD family hydrolase n=1 Tax=Tenacibaculum sp. TC6 TaxID=3423223 RepID=UPI003D35DE4C
MNFIDVHTHSIKNDTHITSIRNTYPSDPEPTTFFSTGIHPWYIEKQNIENEFHQLSQKLLSKNCLAIGECGLDKLTSTEYTLQIAVFKRHIELSETHKKPLIIHCVKAYNDLISLKKELVPKQPWIVHGFNKNIQVAKDLLKNNITLSIGASLLTNKKLQIISKEIPVENILLETDNSKESIINIYNTFATVKNESTESIKKQINKNFNRIFTL